MTPEAASKLSAQQKAQGLELVDVVFSGKKGSYDVRVYIKDRGRSQDQPGRSTKGTIDAIAKAIGLMIPHNAKLVGYDIATNGGGTDAVANATIILKDREGTYMGHGEDTDTPHAAARAYLEAVNEYRKRNQP